MQVNDWQQGCTCLAQNNQFYRGVWILILRCQASVQPLRILALDPINNTWLEIGFDG